VSDLARDSVRQRPSGDRLAVMVGAGEASEQAPPVVDQCDEAGHNLSALKNG
jgi:hypothetical protein